MARDTKTMCQIVTSRYVLKNNMQLKNIFLTILKKIRIPIKTLVIFLSHRVWKNPGMNKKI